jgi:porin
VWGQTEKLLAPDFTFEDVANGFYVFASQRLWYQHPGIAPNGLTGFFQFGYTDSHSALVTHYAGAGLTVVGLIPGRPADSMGVGLASSNLNDAPGAGAFFFPNMASASASFRAQEFMWQAYYQMVLIRWALALEAIYSSIPKLGARPDTSSAHALTARLIALF